MPKTSVGESFTVALISGIDKVWIIGSEYPDFLSTLFCLRVPKTSVGESFTVALISVSENVFGQGGRGVSRFSIENFSSHSAERIRNESFTVALISGTGKVWIRGWGGVSRHSVGKVLSHSPEIFRRGIL